MTHRSLIFGTLLAVAACAPAGRHMQGDSSQRGDGAASGGELQGSRWRLEDLAGQGVLDRVEATLEFPAPDTIAGSGSCNRFSGPVAIEGARIAIGNLAATRMACPEAIMDQEQRYFDALGTAERFELQGSILRIFVAGRGQPLRFVRAEPRR